MKERVSNNRHLTLNRSKKKTTNTEMQQPQASEVKGHDSPLIIFELCLFTPLLDLFVRISFLLQVRLSTGQTLVSTRQLKIYKLSQPSRYFCSQLILHIVYTCLFEMYRILAKSCKFAPPPNRFPKRILNRLLYRHSNNKASRVQQHYGSTLSLWVWICLGMSVDGNVTRF